MNPLTSPVDIRPDHLQIVQDILLKHLPAGVKIWVFGSRANWTTKDSSDLDIALESENKLSHKVLGALKDAFEDSALPYTVDVADLNRIGDSFKKIVESQKVLLPVDGEGTQHVPSGKWRDVITEDIAEKVAMGPFGSSIKVETFVPEGVPVISGQHLHGFRVDDVPGFNFISPEHAQRLANANVHRGDVVFTHAGNIGQVAYIPEDSQFEHYVISQRQFYLRCDRSKALPEFVALYFRSPEGQHQLLANTSQVGVPSIAQPVTYLRTIRIPLPPLSEQRAIAHVLGTLDDKIELNRRMNETLEAMARALFKSWFVDFEPVRAKMEGRWHPGESLPGLPADLYDLFPNRLTDSAHGEIPEGWAVNRIDEVTQRVAMGPFGSSIKVSTFVGDGVPVISGQHLSGTLLEDNEYNFITEAHAERLANANVQRGDIVFTHAGSIGQVSYIPQTSKFERYVISQRQFYVRCDISKISPLFVVHFFKTPEGQHQLLANTSSTGVPSIARPVTYLRSIELCIPPKAIWGLFDKIVGYFYLNTTRNTKESRALAAQRDILLPRLLSGEVRVGDSERLPIGETT